MQGSRRTPGPRPPLAEPTGSGDREISAVLKKAINLMTREDPRESDDVDGSEPGERWTHRFHTWPASLDPDTVALLMGLLPPGAVADPFCGGGTVLIEAMAGGRPAFGWDLSPIAIRVARARTTLATPELLTHFRSTARKAAAAAREARDPPPPERLQPLSRWYEDHVLVELEALRYACMKSSQDVRFLMLACFSAILVKASLRQSDTVGRPVERHRPPGTTAVLFHKKARELARRLQAFRDAVPLDVPSATLHEGDARVFACGQPLAGIITSPPYPGVYDYLPMQMLRSVWLGVDQPALDREMGSRRAFRADQPAARVHWREDTGRWMERSYQSLQPGGRLIVIIGDGRAGGRIVGAGDPTVELGRAVGFQCVARAAAMRLDSFEESALRQEHAILFQKD